MLTFLSELDWSPLWISLKTGIAATIISFFMGIYFARYVVNARGRRKSLIDAILTLPIVLPPTVAGFILLRIFGLRRPMGAFLLEALDIKVVQTWLGCVIAATVISFPLMYHNAKSAFEQIDCSIIHAAETLGMSNHEIFWRIQLPLAKPGIMSGIVLTFARALGEYGATAMLAGNIPGRTSTISQRIAMVIQDGDYQTAGFWTVIVILIGFVIIVWVRLLTDKEK